MTQSSDPQPGKSLNLCLLQSSKYSPTNDRKVVKQADGTLILEDCVRPALTVIENPNYAGKADMEPLADDSNTTATMSGNNV